MPTTSDTSTIPVVLGLDVVETVNTMLKRICPRSNEEHIAVHGLKLSAEAARNPPAWQWSERSSLTSLLVQLLEQAPKEEREVIWSDVEDIITGNA